MRVRDFTARALATVCLLTAAGISSASAADFGGVRGSIKDEPIYIPFSWTGFYVGAHAGLATGDTEGGVNNAGPFVASLTATDYNMDGGIYGGHVGYNYQMGATVIGIEGTFSGTDLEGDTTCVFVFRCGREVDWMATIEARLGYAFGRSLVYARGGVAWADISTDVSLAVAGFQIGGGETHIGWTAGFGFEHAISDRVIARIEYSHYDFDGETHGLTGGGIGPINSEVDASFDTIKLGVGIKFN